MIPGSPVGWNRKRPGNMPAAVSGRTADHGMVVPFHGAALVLFVTRP